MVAAEVADALRPKVEETMPSRPFERAKFLWNQQRYLLENIKLSDTKAGFVMTFAGAVLSAAGAKLALHLGDWTSWHAVARDVTAIAGGISQIAAVLSSAWSIKPRIFRDNQPSPVSWVNVAQYPDPFSFREANRGLDDETSADLLADQVYYMARICVTKHRLVARSIVLALCGGVLLGLSLILG